ncbi:CPBP family intramembrane glutamic endopeptidase [Glaciibacter sp. 2TAF33]|uniref:CPBP family intramembrane glutamic endopeptidase n=1 Tax=Glaciibacter sp. 2TAF33 TaxID=3233015 RepID=UPI003F91CB19
MTTSIRPPLRRIVALNARTGVLLLLVFGVVRIGLVLQANVTGTYQAVSIVFLAMIALPWVLLTREGRRDIGLVRPSRWRWVIPAAAAGAASAILVHLVATMLWGSTTSSPFVYISLSYANVPAALEDGDRLVFFIIFAIIGMLFSPIGEEVLYRGLAHEALATRWGTRGAALIDAGAFAFTHLAHFGLVFIAGAWAFLPLPAVFWVAAMFLASLMFYGFRKLTGSLGGAIVAHAGFNLAMNWVIFYVVLV